MIKHFLKFSFILEMPCAAESLFMTEHSSVVSHLFMDLYVEVTGLGGCWQTKGPEHSWRAREVKVNSSWRRWEIKGRGPQENPLLKGALAFTKDMTAHAYFYWTTITGTSTFLGRFLFSRP